MQSQQLCVHAVRRPNSMPTGAGSFRQSQQGPENPMGSSKLKVETVKLQIYWR